MKLLLALEVSRVTRGRKRGEITRHCLVGEHGPRGDRDESKSTHDCIVWSMAECTGRPEVRRTAKLRYADMTPPSDTYEREEEEGRGEGERGRKKKKVGKTCKLNL